jgi:hypothetical protein
VEHLFPPSKRRSDLKSFRPASNLVLLVLGVYTALFGIAKPNFALRQRALDRAKDQLHEISKDLEAMPEDEVFDWYKLDHIPKFVPVEPSYFNPGQTFRSLLGKNERIPGSLMYWPLERNPKKLKEIRFFSHRRSSESIGYTRVNLNGIPSLKNINLPEANLRHSFLMLIDLRRANLYRANLKESHLSNSNFCEADLAKANLEGSHLVGANLKRVNLSGANLKGADLKDADLEGANLHSANLSGIKRWREIKSVKGTNIFRVKNAPKGFREWAIENGAFVDTGAYKNSSR